MEHFFSKVKIQDYPFSLSHHDKVLSVGSCFSQNIGLKMNELWFDIETNPFGVLFNPISIANLLERSIEQKRFTKEELHQRGDLFFLFDTHGKLADSNPETVLNNANQALKTTFNHLQSSNYLLITFGTAYYFELKEEEKVVGNCHKMPQHLFERKKVQSNQIVTIYKDIFKSILVINPNIQILLTVSPIRHARDGFIENNRSKAELLIATETLENLDFCHYFPSYELQMDELRDYRFYANDLNHPNQQAIDYIFEKFSNSLFSENTKSNLKEIKKIVSQENHRPLFPHSEENKSNLEKLKKRKEELRKKVFKNNS